MAQFVVGGKEWVVRTSSGGGWVNGGGRVMSEG